MLVAVYAVVMFAGQVVYGVEGWNARADAFSVYFGLLARIARSRRAPESSGCPLLAGLPRLEIVPGTIAFVAVMIGTVTFDGLSQASVWADVSGPLTDVTSENVAATTGSRTHPRLQR